MAKCEFRKPLAWKEYNINLTRARAAIAGVAGPEFSGLSIAEGGVLMVDFVNAPDQSHQDAVDAYWAGLSDASDEAVHYFSGAQLQYALAAAKEDAASKSWDALSSQQKKLISGAALLESDNEALVAAFHE